MKCGYICSLFSFVELGLNPQLSFISTWFYDSIFILVIFLSYFAHVSLNIRKMKGESVSSGFVK